jgi:hypothetical protein
VSSTAPTQIVRSPGGGDAMKLVVPIVAGAAVTVVLGVYASVHTPTGIDLKTPPFSGPLQFKVWLATLVAVLALVQLGSAALIYGRTPVGSSSWVGPVHRWSGRVAFVLSVPVAVHCLYVLGFATTDARVLMHSILGCVFYGAFTAKMLILTRPGVRSWVVSVAGGIVFATVIGVVLTSAVWFFVTNGVSF